jgi:hypothetical protein
MRRIWLTLLVLVIGACSMRGAIETMTSPADRAFAQEMVTRLRSGDQEWLERHFHPDLWAQSGKQLAGVPAMFPQAPGETEITSFNTSTSMTNGRTERRREFTLVTHGGGRWTVTSFRTFSDGGPDKVVEWRVVPHSTEPPELVVLNAVDSALPWIWGGVLVFLLGTGALIVWLVRRSRRKHAAQTGTP